VLQRKVHDRIRFTNSDRLFFIQLCRWFPSVLKAVTIIGPETLVRWHRWQNCFAEPLIGSIRRECVDHIIVLGKEHLPRSHAGYYNEMRTRRSLDKDAPALRPVQRTGSVISHAVLGGLHHCYVRV